LRACGGRDLRAGLAAPIDKQCNASLACSPSAAYVRSLCSRSITSGQESCSSSRSLCLWPSRSTSLCCSLPCCVRSRTSFARRSSHGQATRRQDHHILHAPGLAQLRGTAPLHLGASLWPSSCHHCALRFTASSMPTRGS
jgi:hypothetical protein